MDRITPDFLQKLNKKKTKNRKAERKVNYWQCLHGYKCIIQPSTSFFKRKFDLYSTKGMKDDFGSYKSKFSILIVIKLF